MADSLTELLQAVDTYMSTNVKNKTAGPYLATKISAVFEDPNSIFNPSGIVKTIGDKLSQTFANMNAELSVFEKSLALINKNNISAVFSKSMNSLTSFGSSLGKFNTKLFDAGRLLPKLTANNLDTVLQTFTRRIANLNTLNLYGTFDNLIKKINVFAKTLEDAGIDIGRGVMPSPPKGGYVVPANLEPTPKERTLKSNEVINANIVSVNDNVMAKLGKNKSGLFAGLFGGIGGFLGSLFGSKNSNQYKSGEGAKGFLGKIWDWVKSIFFDGLLIFGGLFLLGKIKKFLDETPLGQKIKADFKKFSSMLIDNITKYIKSGDLEKTIVTGIKFIGTILKTVWHFLRDMFNNNKAAIIKMWDSVWNTARDELVMPLWKSFIKPFLKTLRDKFAKIDWSNLWGDVKKWFMTNIIDPIYNNIKKDFDDGDDQEGWAKILGLGTLALVIGSKTGLVGLLSSLVFAFGAVVSTLGTVGGVGLIASLAAFYASMKEGEARKELGKYSETDNKKASAASQTVEQQRAKIIDFQKQLDDINQQPVTDLSILQQSKLQEEIRLARKLMQINTMRAQEQSYKAWLENKVAEHDKGEYSFVDTFLKNLKEQKTWQDHVSSSANVLLNKVMTFVPDLIATHDTASAENRLTKFEKEHQNTTIPLRDNIRDIQEKIDLLLKSPSNIQPINDGVVMVQPNRQDQGVVFGKENGPFSLSNKETMKKLDTLTQVFAEGVSLIMQASVQGSQQIVGAIASTNKGASQATTGGGMDNIGAYRDRVARALNG